MRWTIAIIVSLLIAWWASVQYRHTRNLMSYHNARESGMQALLESGHKPATVLQALAYSRLNDQFVFPPDTRTARKTMESWLPKDSWNSALWIQLARTQFFTGEPGKARVSLERSDELDPLFPRERIESIQLWVLLGEGDRAVSVAKSIADFGGTFLRDSAEALLLSGLMPPDEIFVALGGPDMDSRQILELLAAVPPATPSQLQTIYNQLPSQALQDQDFHRAFAPFTEIDGGESIARELWRLHDENLAEVETCPSGLLISNADLNRDPFVESFHYGWQSPARWQRFDAFWLDSEGPDQAGIVRMDFTRLRENDRRVRWPFYRLVFPKTDTPIEMSFTVRTSPSTKSECKVILQINGDDVYHSNLTDPESGEWQSLRVIVPPQEHEHFAELIFERHVLGSVYNAATILLGGWKVDCQPFEAETAP